MKNKYLKPELEIFEISTRGMLATSETLPDSGIDDIVIGSRPLEITPEDLLGIPHFPLE